MFKAIKKFLFGEDSVGDICKNIAKDKTKDNYQKLTEIFGEYRKYFSGKFMSDVRMATYEMHYEGFMEKDQRNEKKYRYYENSEKNNLAFCSITQLSKFVRELDPNVDKSELSHEDNKLIEQLKIYDRTFADYDYDGIRFYADLAMQQEILSICYLIIDQQKQLQNQEETQQEM